MADITSKQQMYELFNRGKFGNAGLNFDTPDAAIEYGRRTGGLLAIRTKGRGGGPFIPHIPADQLQDRIKDLIAKGWTLYNLQFSAMQPDDKITIQGYMWRGETGWVLDYNDVPGPDMRTAMKHPKHATGLTALMIVRWALESSDYDDLMELFDTYPDAVIEFSAYRCDVGNIPRRRAIIWEVRNYICIALTLCIGLCHVYKNMC